MKGRFMVTELADRGAIVRVELAEQDNHLRYEITGPRYVARLLKCGCDLPGCAGEGVWGRRCNGYAHGQQACHGGSGGFHEEHAIALARAVLASLRPRKYNPKALNGGARIDPNRGVSYRNFVQLDGEEAVDLYSLKHRSDGSGEPETVAARLVCSSRRCVETVTETMTTREVEVTRQRQWSRLVAELPGSVYDVKDHPARDPRIEGRSPHEVRAEHIAWHRETFGTHPRVALDRWIHDHAMTTAPEPAMYEEWGGAKYDQALAIARAERKACAR